MEDFSFSYGADGRLIRLSKYSTSFSPKEYDISYDDVGNPCVYKDNVLKWERGRLLAAYGDNKYSYDADGVRIKKKTANGVLHKYFTEGTRIHHEEYGTHENWYYYDATGIVGIEHDGVRYYFQKNLQGDVARIFNANGYLVARYVYDAWGNHTVYDSNGNINTDENFIGNINPFRYRGYYYDVETGLYYLNTRYYDPFACRFINADDISYIEPETIGGLNLYSYCGNNPIMFTDPEGKFLVSFMASLAIAALIGSCVGVAGTLLSDIVTSALNGNWQFSSWETYLGSAIGGAVGGVVSLFSPFVGSVLAGTISTAAGNIIGKITGSNTASWREIGIDVLFSLEISVATAGMSKYLRISPITKGSHSFQQVFKAGFTKALKYHFSMSAKTLAKEAGYLIVSGFTTGFLASNIVQGIYNVGKTRVKQWLDWINSMRTFSSANFH